MTMGKWRKGRRYERCQTKGRHHSDYTSRAKNYHLKHDELQHLQLLSSNSVLIMAEDNHDFDTYSKDRSIDVVNMLTLNNILSVDDYNKIRKDSIDSFNLYNGLVYDKPESPRLQPWSLPHKLLFGILSMILILIAILSMSNYHTDFSSINSECYNTIDQECGIDICDHVLSLKFGWSSEFVMFRKYNALNMLYNINDEHAIFPNILYLNTVYDDDDFMEFENVSIALDYIKMDITYFCCYQPNQYQEIKTLFQRFHWKQFAITFGNYSCLNKLKTNHHQIDIVLLLDDESQLLISEWIDSFEDYLLFNGIDIKWNNERLLHSAFATFNGSNQYLQNLSLDFLMELNDESNYDELQDLSLTFSKMNLFMT